MISSDAHSQKKRTELEGKISDAADGQLDVAGIGRLEHDLQHFPDLQQDYRDIMDMPDIRAAYTANPASYGNDLRMRRTLQLITSASFEIQTVSWFKKYALAASFVIFALASMTQMLMPLLYSGQGDMAFPELLYPYEESHAEAYAIFLDELIE
ncbi:MAG: hypothetical protein WD266_03350 [Balneolales bacterium]